MPRASTFSKLRITGPLEESTSRPADDVKFGTAPTSVGSLLVAATIEHVVAVLIEKGSSTNLVTDKLLRRFPQAKLSNRHVQPFLSEVVQFVEAPKANLLLPISFHGTVFQQEVWREVLKTPFGETTTFAAIAKKIGAPRAVRAVGNACSQNPLEFAIPCHRVLRSDGSWSGGSAWGDYRQSTIVLREAEALRAQESGGTTSSALVAKFIINRRKS